jgi:hypothetical protein
MTPPYFYIFVIISPLKRTWPFIWTNLNSLYPRIICIKNDWIRPAGSGEEFFLNLLFRYYLPLEIGYSLGLNKLESPSPKDDLCQVWLYKIGPVVLERKIFKWPHPIFTFLWLSPPLKRIWPFIWTNLNSLYPRKICTKFDWIWPAGSGEEDFLKISVYF